MELFHSHCIAATARQGAPLWLCRDLANPSTVTLNAGFRLQAFLVFVFPWGKAGTVRQGSECQSQKDFFFFCLTILTKETTGRARTEKECYLGDGEGVKEGLSV